MIGRISILISLVLGVEGTALSTATAATDGRRFDGTRGVTLTCADFKDASGGATGYTFRFTAEVRDGALRGEHGTPGQAGWLREGSSNSDGAALLQARGTGSRLDRRPCNVVFVRQ